MSRKFEVLLRWISSFGIVKSAAVLAAVAVIAALSCVNHIFTISSCSMIIYLYYFKHMPKDCPQALY